MQCSSIPLLHILLDTFDLLRHLSLLLSACNAPAFLSFTYCWTRSIFCVISACSCLHAMLQHSSPSHTVGHVRSSASSQLALVCMQCSSIPLLHILLDTFDLLRHL